MGKERFLTLATVRKTFGKGGELLLKIHPDVPQNIIDQLNEKEPVFILVDDIPVPFYFIFLQFKGNDKAIVCFENYLSEKLAEEWVGYKILYKSKEEKSIESGSGLVGYSFTAKTPAETILKGIVSGFYDYPGNPCLELEFEGETKLLPLHPDFILSVNHKNRHLEFQLPEGL
ncbi:MAG: hypothetical protein PHP15_03355 [Bacteroidales bacterium]|nr:hypothetical protein [Bacteroidales bacterium]